MNTPELEKARQEIEKLEKRREEIRFNIQEAEEDVDNTKAQLGKAILEDRGTKRLTSQLAKAQANLEGYREALTQLAMIQAQAEKALTALEQKAAIAKVQALSEEAKALTPEIIGTVDRLSEQVERAKEIKGEALHIRKQYGVESQVGFRHFNFFDSVWQGATIGLPGLKRLLEKDLED
jgi:multidrug resistance efflux pump